MAQQQVSIVLNAIPQMAGIRSFVAGIMGIKNATGTAAGAMMAAGRAMSSAIAPLTAALSVAGLVRFTKAAVDAADATAKDAQAAGMAVDQFSRLAYVGDLARASHEQLIVATKGLSQWMEKSGQSGRPLIDVLLEQSDIFQKMPDGQEKIALAMERFGRAGQQMIPMLNQGSAAIRDQMREADQFGATIGPEFAKSAQDFNDNLTRIKVAFQGIFNILSQALLPEFIKLQEAFIGWIKETDAHIGTVNTLIDLYTRLAYTASLVRGALIMPVQGIAAIASVAGNLPVSGSPKEAAKEAMSVVTFLEEHMKRTEALTKVRARIFEDQRKPASSPAKSEPLGVNEAQLAATRNAWEKQRQWEVEQFEKQKERLSELTDQQLELRVSTLQMRGVWIDEAVANEHGTTISTRRVGSLKDEAETIKELLRQRLALLETRSVEVEHAKNDGLITENEALEKQLKLLREITQIKQQALGIDQQTKGSGFFGTLSEELEMIEDQFKSIGEGIAKTLVDGVRAAIDTVSYGLWQVIDGTATWGELFTQVARSVISDLIKVGIQEIVLHNLKKGLIAAWGTISSLWKAKDAATTVATESTKTPVLATNSLLSSISSWGLAAAVGLAAVVAAMAAFGAFEQGGVVRGGRQLIQVNEGGTEAVLNARATAMLGESRVNALNAGIAGSLSSPGPSSGEAGLASTGSSSQPTKLTIVLVDDRNSRAAIDAIESSEGRVVLARVMREQKMEVGIQ